MPWICFADFSMCVFWCDVSESDTDILAAGINGERIAAEVLSILPDDYTVFQDVIVTYGNKKSEIDNIVIGRSGGFIVEVKNHNSHIEGTVKDMIKILFVCLGRGLTKCLKC